MISPGSTVELNSGQVRFFRDNGFLAIDRLIEPEEVDWLQSTFDRLFASKTAWKRGLKLDLVGTDEEGIAPNLPQLLSPSRLERRLVHARVRTNAAAVARQLIGPEAKFLFDHAILKPARQGAATPWHQDEAHNTDSQFRYEQVSIWIPLQDATVENGCLQFIPGSHRGSVMPHRSPNDDPRIQALECIGDFNPDQAQACPVPAGGATIHHCRTLHWSGPNRSALPRYAYILIFRLASPDDRCIQPYSWNASKRTAAQERAEAWFHRGGAIGRQSRRIARAIRGAARRFRNATMDDSK